jgi:deoxyribonuclease (pyrimidine dimer)
MAEYREIRHIGPSLQRSLAKKSGFDLSEIPDEFTLNAGHVKFFYTRGLFLAKRFEQLRNELQKRGFAINPEIEFNLELFPSGFQNDWIPTEGAEQLIRNRIIERISQRPGFYRYYGEKID